MSSLWGNTGGDEAGATRRQQDSDSARSPRRAYGLMVVRQRRKGHRLLRLVHAFGRPLRDGLDWQQTCWVAMENLNLVSSVYVQYSSPVHTSWGRFGDVVVDKFSHGSEAVRVGRRADAPRRVKVAVEKRVRAAATLGPIGKHK